MHTNEGKGAGLIASPYNPEPKASAAANRTRNTASLAIKEWHTWQALADAVAQGRPRKEIAKAKQAFVNEFDGNDARQAGGASDTITVRTESLR